MHMADHGCFKRVLSFYAGRPSCESERDYALAGACFPFLAPLFFGLYNAAAAAGLFALYGVTENALLSSAVTLVLYYLLKGLRLIDGYADCIEGITLASSRKTNPDTVRAAMQSSANGAFGIVWVCLLLIMQFSLMNALLVFPFSMAVILFALCAVSSSHSLISAHAGMPDYHPDSQFASFGRPLGPRSFSLSSLISFLLAFLFLRTAAHFPVGDAALTAGIALAFSTALGLALRLLLQKTILRYNGDVIGFVLLVSENLLLLAAIVALSF